ncbi:hypothetical protein AJ79_00824 [Helicocarpus griseus UAMH5409]|uniref:Hydrophobin n=1 Tax=Helicocarpus griseus UAMH5409 TaxID=1447875 RepID=A0A2B7Y9J6_9EURO|nr:hypothetical protein AJ79_00824 [Helicocarpus griseus UAMH5409]
MKLLTIISVCAALAVASPVNIHIKLGNSELQNSLAKRQSTCDTCDDGQEEFYCCYDGVLSADDPSLSVRTPEDTPNSSTDPPPESQGWTLKVIYISSLEVLAHRQAIV